jgi:Transposase IS66 family
MAMQAFLLKATKLASGPSGPSGPSGLSLEWQAEQLEERRRRYAERPTRDGVELDRALLANWVVATSALLRPLVESIRRHALAVTKLHADSTPAFNMNGSVNLVDCVGLKKPWE